MANEFLLELARALAAGKPQMQMNAQSSQSIHDQKARFSQNPANAQMYALNAYQGGGYQDQINSLLQDILNRPDFSYDAGQDPLYNQYKDRYIQAGRSAMQDTMGQASALTGGFGNSYAATAGQQAYQSYLTGMNDKAMDLYDRALDRYNMDRQQSIENLGLLNTQENQAYARHRDDVADRQQAAEFDFQTRKARKWRRRNPQYFPYRTEQPNKKKK